MPSRSTNDAALARATDANTTAEFLGTLRLDVTQGYALDLPAIVPPLSFKPVMSREQLRTWSDVDSIMEDASVVLVIGYSFARVDEHFNDLLRKGNAAARIVVIGPRVESAWTSAARILGIGLKPKSARRDGRPVLEGARLTCVGGRAEEIDGDTLRALLK